MFLIYLLHIEWNKPIRGAVVVVIVKYLDLQTIYAISVYQH